MSLRSTLREAHEQCADTDISRVEIELLIAHILGVSRMDLHARELSMDQSQRDEFFLLLKKRIEGIPLQYLVGEAPFRYLSFDVGPGVLIPRPETELLVDAALVEIERIQSSTHSQGQSVSVVDLGSGSGAIAISIADEARKRNLRAQVIAVEKSDEAITWLKRNIARHDVDVRLVEADVKDALTDVRCDIVVANPPYIPREVKLPANVDLHEPEIALRGGTDSGLEIPRSFIASASRLLKPGGFLVLEHFETQSAALELELTPDYFEISHFTDLNSRPRWITARRRG